MNDEYFEAKFDQNKIRMDLLPFEALERIADIMTYGAEKYSEGGWKTVPDAQKRYNAALLRHLSAHMRGEIFDLESGRTHIDHMATNAVFLCALQNPEAIS